VLNDTIGIERGLMTTIPRLHQRPEDPRPDPQGHAPRRAAAMSMIPTTTGAARAVGEVLPELQGQARRLLDPRADPTCRSSTSPSRPKRETHLDEVNGVLKRRRRAVP
jgi:glyceraldehyde 3-phosphate dehydrogenase